jgi:hypothetical protein
MPGPVADTSLVDDMCALEEHVENHNYIQDEKVETRSMRIPNYEKSQTVSVVA